MIMTNVELHGENDYDKSRIAEIDNANIMNFAAPAVDLSSTK